MKGERRGALADWLADRTGASYCAVTSTRGLAGGAIQENWLLELDMQGGALSGQTELVLRTDSPSNVVQSLGRAQEFTLLKVAHGAGMTVPEPLFLDSEGTVIGKPFFVMRRAGGTANPRELTRDRRLDPRRTDLAEQVGREIAKLHRIEPPHPDLPFLAEAPTSPATNRVESFLEQLDGLPDPLPILEWGSRWLDRNAPETERVTLCHGDYRTGNIMVEDANITGVLDWEFASWSDPMEDIGWLCARCWRFGADAREAGGLGDRLDLYRGYEAETGSMVDWSTVAYWEIMATARWAIIAHHQGLRHISGAQSSMELALTGRKAAEMEFDVLTQIRAIEDGA
ncbi:MAG: phosphotransferase family protein [Alphaproteobacteria bacterium]|nr:phosphotransferase family protein [Alphaproteobacteria bacterium]